MAEQWAFNPLVQGSTPWRPTWENISKDGWAWHGLWHEYSQSGYRAVVARARSGYIQQLPSGAFRVSVYAGTDSLAGRQIRLRKTCKTERAAQIELGKLLEQAAAGRQPETNATVAELMDRYVEVADWDLSTRKANEVYIRRVIKPALGHLQVRKLRGPLLDLLYAQLRRCSDPGCAGKRFIEHRNVPLLAVDPGSRQPAWRQVVEAIGAAIRSGMLAAGEPLPSVREMSALQDVPVATLQHALAVLADEGLVVVRQGRTAVVAGDAVADRRSGRAPRDRDHDCKRARDHFVLFRADHHRVGVVHHQRGDRRVQAQLPGQRPAQQELVDHPGPRRGQLRVQQRGPVHRERPQRQLQQPAANPAPGPGQRRQAGDRAHRLPAPGVPLDRHPDPDHRRLGGGVLPGQGADVIDRDAGLLRSPFRGVTLNALGQLLVSDGVIPDVGLIGESLADDDVHHGQRERAVGAGPDRDVPVRVRGRPVPDRVDHHDLGAAALRLGHERPQVQVRRDHVAGPDEDVAGVNQALRIHPRGRADSHGVGRAGAGVAVGSLGDRGAELVEERVSYVQAVQDAFGPQVADRHDRLGPVLGDRRSEPAGEDR